VTLHQWLPLDVGQLTLASQSSHRCAVYDVTIVTRVTLTVTLHQWLQLEVGQLTWASQSLTQVS